jgi:hypothetical protein
MPSGEAYDLGDRTGDCNDSVVAATWRGAAYKRADACRTVFVAGNREGMEARD